MLEADAGLTNMAMNANNGQRFEDERVFAQFFYHPVKNAAKSLKEGRDIYEDRAYLKIMIPGDKDNTVERPVRDQDKQRFPKQWAAFENREHQEQEGTPLSEWAGIARSQVEELKFFGITTVEALANMPDGHKGKFLGIHTMIQKAKDFIEDAKYAVPLAEVRAENEELKLQLQNMQEQINQLSKPKRSTRKKVTDDGEIQVDK